MDLAACLEMELKMEMEMRCTTDIDIGTDITPTLTPLSFSLHNSHLHTHCSSCFSPIPNPHNSNSLSYCFPHCSAAHSTIPLSSAELHLPPSVSTSLLRAALRLLLRSRSSSYRVAHLLSNRHKLTCQNDDVSDTIRVGASAMAVAIAKQRGGFSEPNDDAVLENATASLCAVLTNAVEVHDNEGCALGIAVFEPAFSWINHSCSPNACYRFVFSSSSLPSEEAKHLIAPFTRHSQQPQHLGRDPMSGEDHSVGPSRMFSQHSMRLEDGPKSASNLLSNVWYQPEEIFPLDGIPEVWQPAFWVLIDKTYYEIARKLKVADNFQRKLEEDRIFHGDSKRYPNSSSFSEAHWRKTHLNEYEAEGRMKMMSDLLLYLLKAHQRLTQELNLFSMVACARN